MKRFIVLATVALIMALSLLSLQCGSPDYKLPLPIQGRGAGLEKQGLKGLQGDTTEQPNMPLKGFR